MIQMCTIVQVEMWLEQQNRVFIFPQLPMTDHTTGSKAPFIIGCYGPVSSVAACKVRKQLQIRIACCLKSIRYMLIPKILTMFYVSFPLIPSYPSSIHIYQSLLSITIDHMYPHSGTLSEDLRQRVCQYHDIHDVWGSVRGVQIKGREGIHPQHGIHGNLLCQIARHSSGAEQSESGLMTMTNWRCQAGTVAHPHPRRTPPTFPGTRARLSTTTPTALATR